MTAAALLSSARERLNQLLGDEEVANLNSVIAQLADTLPSADTAWNRRLRELAYEIEDSVEDLVRRREVKSSWFTRKWKGSLDKVHERARALVRSMPPSCSSAAETHSREPSREPLPDPPKSSLNEDFVSSGFERNESELKKLLLLGNSKGLSVIAIWGMGGTGKTTLAKRVFSDDMVRVHFQYRCWSTVGQDYQARDIMENILLALSPTRTSAATETMDLAEMIYKTLKGIRYLIVLDDVWLIETWESLRFLFPDDNNGSCILITTRSKLMAKSSRFTSMIEMAPLKEEESWQLFLNKTGLQGTVNSRVQEIVRSIEGNALSISVLAQLFSSSKGLENLELIPLESKTRKDDLQGVLVLSYKNLPFYLKPCFLYMGIFPPDQPIMVDKLIGLWKAEGLISRSEEAGGDEYFKQLVDRNLVNGVKDEDHARFISGFLYAIVRDACISIAKQEEYFSVIDARNKRSSACRIAVYLHEVTDTKDVLLDVRDAKRIRSILFLDKVESTSASEFADLTRFEHVRVLDFDGVNFQLKRRPRGIERLIYLRHLSFRGCSMLEFPSSLGNLSFLETLDLRVIDSCTMTIPNVLRKLTRLKHLYFPLAFLCVGKEKLKLDCLRNLEILENFHASSCDAHDLLQLENLQILTGTVDGNNSDLTNIIDSMKKMKFIRHSSLVLKKFDCYSEERLRILAELLEFNALHALDIEGHLEVSPLNITYGSNLSRLVLNGSEFDEDPMSILGKLPNLRSLVLCDDAFSGQELMCCESGFPQLTNLKLATLESLEKWVVERGAMKKLTTLTIEQCGKLAMLPSELAYIPTLRNLMMGSISQDFKRTVEQLEFSKECSITFYAVEPLGLGLGETSY